MALELRQLRPREIAGTEREKRRVRNATNLQ
jgi:hypothetical protein